MLSFIVKNWYLFLALVVVLGLLAYEPLARARYHIRKLSVLEVPRLERRRQAVVVDVREPHEFNKGHVPGAVNIPLSRLAKDLERLKKQRNKPVIVCCRSGSRAFQGAKVLRRHGFQEVYEMAGGMLAWEKENLPVER